MSASETMRKLTVRVDARWVESAKAYAAKHGVSLSKLISEFLHTLANETNTHEPPILQQLRGRVESMPCSHLTASPHSSI